MKHNFTIITLTIALIVVGISLIPFLPFKLNPSRILPSLTISFEWPDASAEEIEQEAISLLEGALATLPDLSHITSKSINGGGTIELEFADVESLEKRRFEASALIRQIAPLFPKEVSYPLLEINRPEESQQQTLISFTLSGSVTTQTLHEFAEAHFRLPLSQISGVENIEIYGANPYIWELTYDPDQLLQLNIKIQDISDVLQRDFNTRSLGFTYQGDKSQLKSIVIEGSEKKNMPWEEVPIKVVGGRMIYLTDLVKVQFKEDNPHSYYRINGLNTVNIKIDAEKLSNQLEVANSIYSTISQIRPKLPHSYSLIKNYDSTIYLRKELDKIGRRSLFSVGILLICVLLVSQSFRYLLLIVACLFANLAVACIAYYFLKLEMHLYSLAGITVSLGLIIDNSIVMIDHLRHQGNKKVFLAILGATLTTIGAISVIFLLPDNQSLILLDFVWVMIVNMIVSLAVALFFIPAMMEKLPLPISRTKKSHTYIYSLVRFRGFYYNWIRKALKWRPVWISIAILAFGIPVFLLPNEWQEPKSSNGYGLKADEVPEVWYIQMYNHTIGTRYYQSKVKPWMDKVLGGTFRFFVEEVFPNAQYVEPGPTTLYVKGRMEFGNTVSQMNQAFESVENFLAQFDEIKQYETFISNEQSASLSITFKQAYEKTGFPYLLKSRIESQVVKLGAVDWQVYGVGLGFSNAGGMGPKNSRIQMRGYNYDRLVELSENLRARLTQHPRIKEVFLNSEIRWDYRPNSEFIAEFDAQQLIMRNVSKSQLLDQLRPFSIRPNPLFSAYVDGAYTPIILIPNSQKSKDLWHISQIPIETDSARVNMRNITKMRKVQSGDIIYRKDQEYHIWVEFDFIGPEFQRKKFLDETAKATQMSLPLGYTAKSVHGWGEYGLEEAEAYWLIFIVISIIFAICSILLESLSQPFAVVAMIPISFIGIFLTFILFDFKFDQGGVASFLLLSGLSVNAALYILHDFNHFRKENPTRPPILLYLRAFQYKAIPISLTILSTIVGMIPFVWAGSDEPFWFNLAVGTMGGLLFSLVAIVVYLPILVLKNENLQ